MIKLKKEHWNRVKLGDVCIKATDIDYRNAKGTFNYVEIGAINSEVNRIGEIQSLDWNDASSRARQIIKEGDTLFSTVRVNLRRVAFVDREIPEGIASTGFTVIRANEEKAYPPFLFYNTVSESFLEKLISLQVGTAYPAVTDKLVFAQEIPLPPIEEQRQIAVLFGSIEESIAAVTAQEERLSHLKKNLLADLFSEKKKLGNYLKEEDFEVVCFEHIATNISERVEPKATLLDTYVGLDHLDPDDLRIRRLGKPDDVIGTKLRIYTGDIIFGKRRAYQRKVAVSHFDGIASAHSMILRAKAGRIEKDFLPFFMQSDAFMNRAVQISEGSLSPTIKWKALAQQAFILPKKEKQAALVDLFVQMDSTREELFKQKGALKRLKVALLNEILG